MLDNIADLLLAVGLLNLAFGFPTKFALHYMVPGTAVGVLVGDLLFFVLALRLAKKTGRKDITAMPLGLDTPSTFGLVLFVFGPVFLAAKSPESGMTIDQAAMYTWQIGICAIFISGLFKIACALGAGWIRRIVPRAGLLGSLAAIALVLISFLPLLEILHTPIVGFAALAIILTTLVAKVRLPGRIPGALGALLVGGLMYWAMDASGVLVHHARAAVIDPADALLPTGWLTAFSFEWINVLGDSLRYLPIVIPFALATVVGGIDCTESAAAVGDEYNTTQIIAVDALATLAAGLCGGMLQTTPYIGHPAYKAMGGRAAYTLATAIFVGSAGLLGYFAYMYLVIPKAAIFPILVFIGLEITAQSFHATKKAHYPAVALACVPAMAALVTMFVGRIFGDRALWENGIGLSTLKDATLRHDLLTVRVLSAGFIVTSLLWASMLASIIDHRLRVAALFAVFAAAATLFGVIHSPLDTGAMFLPWDDAVQWPLPGAEEIPYRYAAGYAVVAVMLSVWDVRLAKSRSHDETESSTDAPVRDTT